MAINENDVRLERMPSDGNVSHGWNIRRASHEKALLLVCISHDLYGVRTHFWNRRTGPCLRNGCQACKEGQLSRWTGYIEAVDVKDSAKVLFEFTEAAAPTLGAAFTKFKTLRGLSIIACRTAPRANAKVHLTVKGMHAQAHDLSEEVPVWPILSHIWGLSKELVPTLIPNHRPTEEEVLTAVESANRMGQADESAWMNTRAQELAGQLKLLEVNGKK